MLAFIIICVTLWNVFHTFKNEADLARCAK